MTCYEDLMYRGLIKDMTNNEDFVEKLNEGNMTFYWGTDPTADSLHIGHYSSLLTAKRLMKYGHHPILLVGGATGLIGDPRPTAEREIIDKSVVENNIEGIKKQVLGLFDNNVEVVNNYDWIKDFTFIDFLRDVGKYINVNYMLNKDIISRRLETGITYAEFSYTLLQGYDFVHLYKEKNCIMQAAGSDQWGNITTGVELIGKMLGKEAYAFTMPLILDSNGNKFGKSEGNALWLDKNKTPAYDIYQYLINASDDKVEDYLKVFTFLDKDEIDEVMRKHNEKPEDRLAQKTLAYEFIKDLHGEEEANQAKIKSEALFGGSTEGLEATPITPESRNILDIMMAADLIPSKSEGRRLVEQGGVSIDDEKITDPKFEVTKDEFVLHKGKKKVVKLIIK
ncbi:MAG: tyrosine--tRNA ligase [Bacilli bacterium]|nr:tyrosine--tRNA ligase [Bacilli bacterium]